MFFNKRNESELPPKADKDLDELRSQAKKAELPENVAAVVAKELEKLDKTDPSAAEYAVGLNYIDLISTLPWNTATEDSLDLALAERVMNARHHGLRHVKERLLDYLASRMMRQEGRPHILVVDDEDIARANLEHVLRKEGYQVRGAANGALALEEVRRFQFDLIVTDLKMDRMDGMQLLEAAKAVSPATRIMIVTGFATVDSAVAAMRGGAVHYLAKPINLDELRRTVRELIRSARPAAPMRGPVLCFSGPPGTGKTSIGMSIAEALGRKFYRMSLAGLRDEAELRGHRRTYVGALPGKIIGAIKRLGVKNPVFMLDEIDKIGQDFKGDPSAVFLEVLDPEQNRQFLDYFVDLPFDLSSVMFIATANVLDNLDTPLRDRLEIVNFPGYTESEKRLIAANHIVPRQAAEHGLTRPYPTFTDAALGNLIQGWTREAGVRGLDREIAGVCRKLARTAMTAPDRAYPAEITPEMLPAFLGPPRFTHESAEASNRVGVATGLVWSEFGGEIIFVETLRMKGAGNLIMTGSLGEVLKESAQAALSYIRGNAADLGIDPDFFAASDIHIHIPAAGIPKDGPSAGITILAALLSLLSGRPVRPDTAMSGEITLSGRLLPVGGVREKILAAGRAGLRRVLFPARNQADLNNLEPDALHGMETLVASDAREVFTAVLM